MKKSISEYCRLIHNSVHQRRLKEIKRQNREIKKYCREMYRHRKDKV